MQLVMLCREQDLQFFGQDLVFSRLVNDLRDIEESGIILDDGEKLQGALIAIVGDNLGSHSVGGFTENFSKSKNFCRYCMIHRDDFEREPTKIGPLRTQEAYKNSVRGLSLGHSLIDGGGGGTQHSQPSDNAASDTITLTLTPVTELEVSSIMTSPQCSVPLQNKTWTSTFKIPWEKTRPTLQRCLSQNTIPEDTDRRHMVRITVDAMREKCLNPTWSQCTVIAKSVVDKYPGSFEDRTDEGDRMGNGYFTLSSQLKNRVDNLNRNNTLARLRKPKRPADTNDVHPAQPEKVEKTDSYGCINWQPSQLPEGETIDSLHHHKRRT
ncbi:hypothetical protein DPX16_23865 [Anabarilius grahami]|uniref:Uncharacterized protein n=1 Tax=Anabarilius grahami TaxID=495550 RepID=A0A3N0Z917_ANAGA|nr:hypothetical protein DPX16_23865 [Anabarilius grahami]